MSCEVLRPWVLAASQRFAAGLVPQYITEPCQSNRAGGWGVAEGLSHQSDSPHTAHTAHRASKVSERHWLGLDSKERKQPDMWRQEDYFSHDWPWWPKIEKKKWSFTRWEEDYGSQNSISFYLNLDLTSWLGLFSESRSCNSHTARGLVWSPPGPLSCHRWTMAATHSLLTALQGFGPWDDPQQVCWCLQGGQARLAPVRTHNTTYRYWVGSVSSGSSPGSFQRVDDNTFSLGPSSGLDLCHTASSEGWGPLSRTRAAVRTKRMRTLCWANSVRLAE